MGTNELAVIEAAIVAVICGFMVGFTLAAIIDRKIHDRELRKYKREYLELLRKYYDATGDGLPPPDETEPYKKGL